MSNKHNPYRDLYEHIDDEQLMTACGIGTTPPIPVYTYPITYIADECIEKIADAVVRKIKGSGDE